MRSASSVSPRRSRSKSVASAAAARAPGSRTRRPITPEDLGALRLLSHARISPDGRGIVFVSKQVGDKNDYLTNLWIASAPEPRTGRRSPRWTVRQFTAGGKDSAPEWSPDGTRLAFVSGRDKAKPQIWTIPITGGDARPLTKFAEGSLGSFKWSPDGRWIAVAFRPTSPEWTTVASKERQASGQSDPPRVLDDIFYREDGEGYFGDQRYALHLVDAASGESSRLYEQDTLGTMTFDFSPTAPTMVVATDRRRDAAIAPAHDELVLIDLKSRRARPIPGLPVGCKAHPQFSPDGSAIAYAGHTGTDGLYSTDNIGLWVCDAIGGEARCLTKATDYCLVGGAFTDTGEPVFTPVMRWTRDSRAVLAQISWHGCTHIARIPRRGVRSGEQIMLTRGDAMISLGNLSSDGSSLAVTRARHNNPGEVCVARLSPSKDSLALEPVADLNTDFLKSVAIARPSAHWLKSDDGTRIQTWVMQPPGASRRRRPAILMIHGGPHAQYGVGYFHEFQCLAAAGYAVVFSNPRGSKGYGRDHCAAIRGDWGNKDWQDLQAVLAFMQGHASIDAKRLGVEGGSYGGYMTNWIVGRSRAFRAAVTDRCVSNLVSMGGNSDYPDPPDRYWPGNFWDRPEARWAQSPIKDFGKVRTPMLIIHSEGDLRCNIEQSEQVFAALKLRKIRCRFIRYPRNCSHGMSRSGPPDMRIHRLQQIMRWWDERL